MFFGKHNFKNESLPLTDCFVQFIHRHSLKNPLSELVGYQIDSFILGYIGKTWLVQIIKNVKG